MIHAVPAEWQLSGTFFGTSSARALQQALQIQTLAQAEAEKTRLLAEGEAKKIHLLAEGDGAKA